MLRGNFSAKIDDKSRLKIPTLFRSAIEDRYGTQLFITSLTGALVLIYPMPVWKSTSSVNTITSMSGTTSALRNDSPASRSPTTTPVRSPSTAFEPQ